MIADESGVSTSQFIATEDGFEVLSIDETDDELLVEGFVGTFEEVEEEEAEDEA